jgi:TP901 family phage tail tape measure protein
VARELRVVIAGDTSRLSGAYGTATRDTHSFGRAITSVAGTALRGLAIGAGITGVAVAVGMKKSVDAAGEFQASLNVLQAVTQGSNAQMAKASKLAIALGNDAKLPAVSAKDAADSMLELGKAGLTVVQSMGAARATLLLATAAETDNATAAKVVAQNLQAFHLRAKDASTIVDQMAGVMNNTGLQFVQFADSLTYTAAISHTVGQAFDDTATQIAILARAGIEGSMAGTGLRTILADLGNSSSVASTNLKAMGVSTVDAHGKFVGMRSVIDQLKPSLDKMTNSQRLAFFQTNFGKYAMNAANIILGESATQYDKVKAAIDRKGQADKLAASHMKGYRGAVGQLSNALQTLQVEIGLKLLPVATRLATFLPKVASAPNISVAIHVALQGIKSLAGDAQKAIGDALFGSSHTITIGGEGRSTRVVMSQGIISQLQNYDWGKLLNGSSKTIVIGGEGRASRVEVSGGLLGSISTAFQGAMAKIDWTAVGQVAGTAIGASIVITTTGFDRFAQTAMAWANSHAGQIAGIGAVIGLNVVSKLLDPSFWLAHWQLIGGIAISVFPVSKFAGLGGKLAEAAFGRLGELVTPLVLAALEKLPGKVGSVGLSMALKIGEGISKGIPAATGKAVDLVEGVVRAISGQFGRLAPLVKVLLNTGIVSVIGGLIGAAVSKAEQLATAIANGIKTAPSKLVGLGGDLLNKIQGAVTSVATGAYNLALSIGSRIADGVVGGVGDLASKLTHKLTSAISSAVSAAGGLLHGSGDFQFTIHAIGEPMMEGILQGLRNKAPSLQMQLVQGIRAAVTQAKSDAMTAASDLGGTIGDSISAGAARQIAALSDSPLGQQLAALNKQITDRQNAEQLASLQGSLASAQATGDPAQIQQAQQALDDWQLQQQQTTLQAQLDAQANQIQKTADMQASGFQSGLTALTANLNKGLITQDQYNEALQTLLKNSGQDYGTIGNNLGSYFANGFRDALAGLAGDISTIISGPNAIIRGRKATATGPAIGGGGVGFHGFADGGIVRGGRGGLLGMIGEGKHDELITPLESDAGRRALGGGGGDTFHVHIAGDVLTEDQALEKFRQGMIRLARRGTGGPGFRSAFGTG